MFLKLRGEYVTGHNIFLLYFYFSTQCQNSNIIYVYIKFKPIASNVSKQLWVHNWVLQRDYKKIRF